jgi:hypothetical protein
LILKLLISFQKKTWRNLNFIFMTCQKIILYKTRCRQNQGILFEWSEMRQSLY